MVAGDLVNTASRAQAAAEPNSVLVGEATRRATEAAIAYSDAGLHEVKGKAEPIALSRALRVTAGRGGGARAEALEPPFVGRERELRLLKELFPHERRGAAIQSRLHRRRRRDREVAARVGALQVPRRYRAGGPLAHGRCLAYRGGATYWALAEMVRAEPESPGEGRRLRGRSSRGHRERGGWRGRARLAAGHVSAGLALLGAREALRPRRPLAGWRVLRGDRPAPPSCWCSKTFSGRTHRCSTSSSTCSTGRAVIPSSFSPSPGRSWPNGIRAGRPGFAMSPTWRSSR